MAMCIIGKRYVFSEGYRNYADDYDVDALIGRVYRLLNQKYPNIEWFPETSSIGVEHTSLRAAKAENPITEIEAYMKQCWAQAVKELDES